MKSSPSAGFFRVGSMVAATVLATVPPATGRAQPRASSALPASPTAATGADENTRLQALFRKGISAFEAGNDQESLKALGEAWAIRHTYDIAAALAQTELALERYRDAAEHLDYGLNHFVPGESEKTLEVMRSAFAEVKQRVAALRLQVDEDGATLELGGRTLGVSPLPKLIFADPGAYTLKARLGERETSQRLDVQAGQEYLVQLELADAQRLATNEPRQPPLSTSGFRPPPSPESDRSWVPVFVGASVTALGVVGLGTFGTMAASDADTMQQLREKNGAYGCSDGSAAASDCAAQHDAAISHDKHRNLALASALVGAVGLAAIPVYWFWPRGQTPVREKAASRLRMRGAVGPGSVAIFGEF